MNQALQHGAFSFGGREKKKEMKRQKGEEGKPLDGGVRMKGVIRTLSKKNYALRVQGRGQGSHTFEPGS